MAVIINELEVVLESPASKPGPTPAAPPPQASQQLTPIDIEDVLQREARATYRLLAH